MSEPLRLPPETAAWLLLLADDRGARPVVWGEVCADQADGFAPDDVGDSGSADPDDDHGYGHGV